ncbi:competence protein CoiA [Bacillus sp. V59.32b]|uniref:competence protein CoiA n=1 Tax=Bacillus sp. V59.32b TaxID=1758642 RepID=UPI00135BA151|nr:competence protein CoiA family protein [Bacillus sp. V59.32b]
MLTAKNKSGAYVTLHNTSTKEKLLKMKQGDSFYCPCCEHEVIIKSGKIKIPHFAHIRNNSCHASSEPESDYHLLGKTKLYLWLKSKKYHAFLEAYIPEIRQRADILVIINSQKYAIEFQCSAIPEEDFISRTNSYRAQGIIPIWILADRNIKKIKPNEFSLRNFDWFFLTGGMDSPSIITYCPYKDQLTKLEKILPFSPRTVFANQCHETLSSASFPSFFHASSRQLPYLRQWREKRKSWSFQSVRTAKVTDPFFQFLYVNQISPATLPPEVGIPVAGIHLIHTAAVQWQAYVFIDMLFRKEAGQSLSMDECIRSFKNRIKSGDIRLRKLPLLDSKEYLQPLISYVSFFKKTGYIEEYKTGYFKVMKKVRVAKTYDQWLEWEKNFYYRHQKLLQADNNGKIAF